MRAANGTVPRWNDLFGKAQEQAGYFTTRQAADHHISTALLTHHLKNGQLRHAGRGIFRFVRYPSSDRDELVPLWLWSNRMGVFSHDTALSLLGLSDLAPIHVEMTVPSGWEGRRLKSPQGVILHFAKIPQTERSFWGPVPITTALRTLNDCAEAGTERQFLLQAVREAQRRGLLVRADTPRLKPQLRKLLSRVQATGRRV